MIVGPQDREAAQAVLDPAILDDEIDAWVAKTSPDSSSSHVFTDPKDVVNYYQAAANSTAARRLKAPIVACNAKQPNGQVCGRKTVGKRGAKCYDHRVTE